MFPISSKARTLLQLIRDYQRILIYAVVGGINTGADFAVFTLLYLFTPLPLPFVQAISYGAGVLCSFVLNRNVTFRDGVRARLTHQAGRFIAVNFISFTASIVVISLLTLVGVPTVIAKMMVTVLTAAINYFGYKVFVFRVKGR